MNYVHTVVHDLDGTILTNAWPELGEFQPGAVESLKRLHELGIVQTVFSARLSPYDPFTSELRDPAFVAAEVQRVRAKLDEAGLTFLKIWTLPGKPGATIYTDDRAERYNPGPRGWERLTERILMRLGMEEAAFPEFNMEVALDGAGSPRG